jgi:hypothetical protein
VSAPETDKITIHANMEPRLWIAALTSRGISHTAENTIKLKMYKAIGIQKTVPTIVKYMSDSFA